MPSSYSGSSNLPLVFAAERNNIRLDTKEEFTRNNLIVTEINAT